MNFKIKDKTLLYKFLLISVAMLLLSLFVEPFPFTKTITSFVLLVFAGYVVPPMALSYTVKSQKFNEMPHKYAFFFIVITTYFLALYNLLWNTEVEINFLVSGLVMGLVSIYFLRKATLTLFKAQEKQEFAKTGLYSKIRHPQYVFITLFLLSVALTTKSLYAFLFVIFSAIIFYGMIRREESFLFDFEEYGHYVERVGIFPKPKEKQVMQAPKKISIKPLEKKESDSIYEN